VDPLVPLIAQLASRAVRFVVIGVAGANYYALGAATIFSTQDRDLFLPPDPHNMLRAWQACEAAGLALWVGREPLDSPRDALLSERVVDRRVAVRASDGLGFDVDLTVVMAGLDFETVWNGRRFFQVEGVAVPVARLVHIVTSKHAAGRDKDRLFLATHRQALEDLLRRES
jgi:hypothetical protein